MDKRKEMAETIKEAYTKIQEGSILLTNVYLIMKVDMVKKEQKEYVVLLEQLTVKVK